MSKIYVMTHKIVEDIPNDNFYTPLHVGRALNQNLGYLADNTGDNISEKNKNYCELTGLYWLWKNCKEQVVGTCHYRRYFIENEAIITQKRVDEILGEYDIITPVSSMVHGKNIYEHYKEIHFIKDLDTVRDIIQEKHPDYLDAFDVAMNIQFIYFANMMIAPKAIYDQYCQWLFDILFEVEKRTDISDYDQYQARIFGFISERLFRVWLFKQNLKIYECETKEINPDEFENANKTVELRYNLVKLKHRTLIDLYNKGVLQNDTLIPPWTCKEDFDDKTPVWWCWWQGLDELPEVVAKCLESLRRNLPDNTTLRIITFDNMFDYVCLSPAIIDKFNNGHITMTTLSDVLRNELLYRYGGMWIDATYYVNKKIDKALFEREYYTLRYDSPVFESDITKGRYSGNLQIARKGNLLNKFVSECFLSYYETEDEIVDYYQIDYCIAMAIELFNEVRKMLSDIPAVEKDVLLLNKEMNALATESRIARLQKAPFIKLSYRDNYKRQIITGEDTLYNSICI